MPSPSHPLVHLAPWARERDGRSVPPGRGLFTADDYAQVNAFFDRLPDLPSTPLTPLPHLAASLGLGGLLVKDETARFGLNAFKLLGVRYALAELLADGVITPGDTLVCASEGNHGRAVAHAARQLGCACRVYLSASVAAPRVAAIAGEGAAIVRVAGTYDDAVRQAATEAATHGWTVVSDTSWPGYERIPWLIMLGYSRMMQEIATTIADGPRPSAIFVPGGVGGLLAAVASWCAWHWPDGPRVVAVEPASAACLQASARAGRPTVVPGPFDTMMGGLRCGEVSPLAFDGALATVHGYVAIEDGWAEAAMRRLARPGGGDPPIEVGGSGAATLGGLMAVLADEATQPMRDRLGLGAEAQVIVIASEGVTDPDLFARVVGDAR